MSDDVNSLASHRIRNKKTSRICFIIKIYNKVNTNWRGHGWIFTTEFNRMSNDMINCKPDDLGQQS